MIFTCVGFNANFIWTGGHPHAAIELENKIIFTWKERFWFVHTIYNAWIIYSAMCVCTKDTDIVYRVT